MTIYIILIVLFLTISMIVIVYDHLSMEENKSCKPYLHVIITYHNKIRTNAQLKAIDLHMSMICKKIIIFINNKSSVVPATNIDQTIIYTIRTDMYLSLFDFVDIDQSIPFLWFGNNIIPIRPIYEATFIYGHRMIICNTPIDHILLGITRSKHPFPLVPIYIDTIRTCKSLDDIWYILLARVDVIFDNGRLGVVTYFTNDTVLNTALTTYALQWSQKHRKKQRFIICAENDNKWIDDVFQRCIYENKIGKQLPRKTLC